MAKRRRKPKKKSSAKDFSYVEKHVLVPKHSKVSEKEKKQLFDQYSIDVQELPKIFIDDPAIISLDAKPGDIIKISRYSPVAGESVFYRVVIEGI